MVDYYQTQNQVEDLELILVDQHEVLQSQNLVQLAGSLVEKVEMQQLVHHPLGLRLIAQIESADNQVDCAQYVFREEQQGVRYADAVLFVYVFVLYKSV